ncbi:uncharacterized protein F5891DRAFT_1198474 [Suillus fuscotomentosus]|uniref:Uncharacterized protein n=1 Tax=Suillus fuscotomentosus TaxID=1912939 RepID=A0AAD4HCX9_9AGAM|nr:uncharacterized protein F5891DRAFT_1198474 [Suillus fuscotomentosus]KAG1889703.1 hypothetical protein F5891DRAFT_1198474 [Suillus fuscotomentosus]
MGQQAKAEAADIFKAVLRSIAECEKPTRSLQEAEAYSKLYYQTHIKATVDEVLKAEAELLQVKNKTLTNGKCVAIAKQHTASLYSVETDEIKAEVQKYIENQKMEKGDEAKMWSQDDYARNLEKLATIANKFLKGLVEATGFSFSLPAGGPSPECNGSIDVYRHFGNDFSKMYPEFERGIMAPFRDYLYRVYPDLAVLNGSLGTSTMGEADKSAPETSRVSLSLMQPDSVGQTFSGNTTGDNWNLDEDFWTTLAAQVADFNRSGGSPVLPESTSQFSSPTLQHVAPEVSLPLLHVPQSITPITSLYTALAPPLPPLLPGSQPVCLMPLPPPVSQPVSLMPPPPPVSQLVSLIPPPPPISTPPVSPLSPPCMEPFAGGGGHSLAHDGEPSD